MRLMAAEIRRCVAARQDFAVAPPPAKPDMPQA